MEIKKLIPDNVEEYISYLKTALHEEPEMMTTDEVNEDEIRKNVNKDIFKRSTSLLAYENGEIAGRIEYHFYGCIQDGYKMAYVNWVYVRKKFRKQGIAKQLFAEFEKDCINHDIDQYFLLRAENESAEHFYRSFEGAELGNSPILRKNIQL
ncbi:MAG: GNAT family N-acetyltransferase [Firmicutes bacterium]|nr:GNAT family N-acetyltransferase [[Eubacterium] siraeum]MCM1488706.1 GNAT family N-acetyltransferase [Bacillota bacterium]